VHAGQTDIFLIATDQPTVSKQPNGDQRTLLLGVQRLHISPVTGSPQATGASCSCTLTNGWNQVEKSAAGWLRWTQARAEARLFVPVASKLTLRGRIMSAQAPNTITISLDGKQVGKWRFSTAFQLQSIPNNKIAVPAGNHVLEFRSDKEAIRSPNDTRLLGVAIKDLTVLTVQRSGTCEINH
jgi:hypothetical protein